MAENPRSDMRSNRWKAPVSRRAAALLLFSFTIVAFLVRVWNFKTGLPNIFYSDFGQLSESVDFIRSGSFVNHASYPPAHVFLYVAADYVAFFSGWIGGAWSSFDEFARDLVHPSGPTLRHSIAHVYTAFMGALLVPATYRLARTALPRTAALAAASFVIFAPVFVIYSHQARIHVPGITFVVVAAFFCARMLKNPGRLSCIVAAGIALAFVSSIIQLGYLLGVSVVVAIAIHGNGWRAAARTMAVFMASTAAAYGIFHILSHPPTIVLAQTISQTKPALGERLLGVPLVTIQGFSIARFVELAPQFWLRLFSAEPVLCLLSACSIILLIFKRVTPRPASLLWIYPFIVLVGLGTSYTHVRYSMSVTPFFAVLAAWVLLQLRPRALSVALAIVCIAVSAAQSLRFHHLLQNTDTRIVLDACLDRLSKQTLRVSVDDAITLRPFEYRSPVEQFPPFGNYSIWPPIGKSTPQQTFAARAPEIFFFDSSPRHYSGIPFSPRECGYSRCGEIVGGPPSDSYLPDAPDYLIPQLWTSSRTGPSVTVWVKTPAAGRRLRCFALPGVDFNR